MNEAQFKAEIAEHDIVYASRQDVEAAYAALTAVEKKKLMVAAIYWCKKFWLKGSDFSPEDLLQEALLRALKEEHGRKWPKNVVDFVKFLDRSMESIAGHHRAKIKAETQAKKATDVSEQTLSKEGLSAGAPVHSNAIEDKIAAQEELDELRSFFADDSQAFQAVCFQADGLSVAEIQDELGIDAKEWETVRKRVHRKLAKYLKTNREEK